MNEREKEILILRYGLSNNDELTQKDVADLLGISQSYISRLEKKNYKKLRKSIKLWWSEIVYFIKKATLIWWLLWKKKDFMSAIPIQKTLSKEELYILIQNYQKNHDQKSKEMIILSNTKLVLSLMKRFYQKSNHYEDLFQVGIVGLIKAVDHFDTNYQLQFSTYAVPLIIGEMKRYLRDNTQVKISRPIKDLAYAILKEKEKYLNQYQREPTIQELSQNLNIEKQNIIEAMQSTQSIASFQDVVGNDNQNELSLSDIVSLDPETLKHYHDHLDLKNCLWLFKSRERK